MEKLKEIRCATKRRVITNVQRNSSQNFTNEDVPPRKEIEPQGSLNYVVKFKLLN